MTGHIRRRLACAVLGLLSVGGSVAGPAQGEPQPRGPRATPPAGGPPGAIAASRGPVVSVPPAVRVGVAGGGDYAVRSVEIEDYVAGVLMGEAARDSDPAVLQALAVAIRTYALKNLNRHGADGFDVCDQTHCQVWRRPTAATTSAAAHTAGQVLTWRGSLATVYYSASCGGHSQIPSSVWPGAEDPPYLPSRADDGCGGDPEWTATLRATDIERTLRAGGYRGSLRRIRVTARDRSGRVSRLGLDGLSPSSIGGPDLRMALGPTQIKSTAFDVRLERETYVFGGRGYGHGVGMCVIGATKLAARGESAEALLARYYPGATLGMIDTGRLPVVTTSAPPPPPPPPARAVSAVPSVTAPTVSADRVDVERREIDTLLATAVGRLAADLGVPAPPALPIEVHTTDDAYERATGRHWFTLGALVAGRIHLMPIGQLRQRGVLDRIIRREVIHGLLDHQLRGKPQWVRDGAALYFADPPTTDGGPRRACPSDPELLQPVSAGALAQAYDRARGCFARQLSEGRHWRDVR